MDKVKQILSKSPTGTKEKLDEQLALMNILCQHKAGTVSSADVTEGAKNSMVSCVVIGEFEQVLDNVAANQNADG